MNKPKVTIFMPVYNSEEFISETVESILSQTFTDYEFLIVDDGSTDKTLDIIERYNDPRIKVVKNEKNMGLPYTRNLGLQLSRGEYFALIDADDICYKDRIKTQVDFLDNNDNVGVVSTHVKVFGKMSIKDNIRLHAFFNKKLNSEEIKAKLIFSNFISNPSAMIRKSVLIENNIKYRAEYSSGQDYGLWIDLLTKTNFHIISKKLLKYRFGHGNVTQKSKSKREAIHKILSKQLFENINLSYNEDDINALTTIMLKNKDVNNITDLENIYALLEKLCNHNIENGIFNNSLLMKEIQMQRYYFFVNAKLNNISLENTKYKFERLNAIDKLVIYIKVWFKHMKK
ncbi:glycosyl transferase [Clostridium polyendosporum]|uniref:Glycosyl transferase n=1 Tax=Clostridium polyendosporum TaxID=69208 RepID=A0A919VN62_9CLOT|nr:glycosyltransferase family 2 protein [Clostridium polyendosporum]GIM30258.1 glycosyl transferase [Clostridium polyendosporum]